MDNFCSFCTKVPNRNGCTLKPGNPGFWSFQNPHIINLGTYPAGSISRYKPSWACQLTGFGSVWRILVFGLVGRDLEGWAFCPCDSERSGHVLSQVLPATREYAWAKLLCRRAKQTPRTVSEPTIRNLFPSEHTFQVIHFENIAELQLLNASGCPQFLAVGHHTGHFTGISPSRFSQSPLLIPSYLTLNCMFVSSISVSSSVKWG